MSERVSLEDVLHDYGYETGKVNDPAVLRKYVEKYPQFYDELVEFATSLSMLKYAPEIEISSEEERAYRRRGVEKLRTFLKKKPVAIASLNELAKEQGLDKIGFASTLGISVSLVMSLEKRRLEASSIPRSFIKKIADSIKSTEEYVVSYLSAGPELSPQASFKAESRPEPQKKKSFIEAVKEDQILTNEQKESLMKLL